MAGIAGRKIKEWLMRYGPAEVVSLVCTLLAGWIIYQVTSSRLQTSIGATISGNIGYFGTILLQDVFETVCRFRKENKQYTFTAFLKNIRALFIEFGVAEVLDTLFIRPFLLYQMPVWLDNLTVGLIVAKFAADITFYLPAILFYEWSKKRFRKF